MALEVGFANVRSVELSDDLYRRCLARFECDDRVRLYHGDSSESLWHMIVGIDSQMTFWLDGHFAPDVPDIIPVIGKTRTPLLEELRQIAKHPRKDHIILIDDIRVADTYEFDFISKQAILDAVYDINKDYSIYYEDNIMAPNDILVARIS